MYKNISLFGLLIQSIACFNIDNMAPIYTRDYCQSIEIAYGKNLLSAGGTHQINLMFSSIDLENKTILDFGSGMGGVAFHLASNHNCFITGVDVLPSMIDHSIAHTPANIAHKLSFQTIDSTTLPFDDCSFDIIYSKEVMLHLNIQDKQMILAEFQRILKPDGMLIINDWLSPQDDSWCQEIQQLIDDEDQIIYAVSPSSYEHLLQAAGFTNIANINSNPSYIQHNQDLLKNLHTAPIKNYFITQYDEETWKLNIVGYEYILQALQDQTLLINNIYAQK